MEVYPEIKVIEITSLTSTVVEIQINLEEAEAEAISSVYTQPCYLRLKVNENLFLDPESANLIETSLELQVESPRMLDK